MKIFTFTFKVNCFAANYCDFNSIFPAAWIESETLFWSSHESL